MNIPGFTAEFALSMAGRVYRTIKILPENGDASVVMAKTKVSGPGGTQCELDSTITVEEAGGTSTTNIWKCTTTVDVGGSGTPGTPFEGGEGGSGGSGGSSPGSGVPATDVPSICKPPHQNNPDYDPTICTECIGVCDSTYPITPCEGSKTWCNAINAEPLRERRRCYEETCGWRCAPCV